MDLIGTLSSQLGVDSNQAQAVAGSLLGGVAGAVKSRYGDETADQVTSAVPELSGWQAQAASLLGDQEQPDEGGGLSGALGGLLGAGGGAGGMLGKLASGAEQLQDIAAITGLLGKLGVDAGKATLVAPLLLSFLKDRLPEDVLDKALKVAPLLSGGGGAASAAGMLGGLFD